MKIVNNPRQFTVENFEGPLDLLLTLIRDKKMDILEISLVKIADQYIEFVNNAQYLDLDLASEYFLIAAQLLEIKSRYLLKMDLSKISKEETAETENLLSRLIEYEKFKKASKKLNELLTGNVTFAKEDDEFQEIQDEEDQIMGFFPVTSEDLEQTIYNIFQRVKANSLQQKTISLKRMSLEDRKQQLNELFASGRTKWTFAELIGDKVGYFVAITLLILLEMALQGFVKFSQEQMFSPIIIEVVSWKQVN